VSLPKRRTALTTTLQLLKAKRSSAIKDARKIEAQLARLNESAEATGIKTNLRYVTRLFRDHIAALDEAIKSTHTSRSRQMLT
jgi:chorismate mutase